MAQAERSFRRSPSFLSSEPHEGNNVGGQHKDTNPTGGTFVTLAVNHAVHRMNVEYVSF